MVETFLKIVNMSISASWIVFVVLLARILLKKAPKWINCILWGIVAIRLVFPFSVESVLSLMPSTETVSPEIMMSPSPEINTGIPVVNNTVNPIISGSFAPYPGASVNPLQIIIPIAAVVWIAGMAVMLMYTAVSYFVLHKKISTSVLLRDNIFQSENVVSPFVLGIIKPKIYLPFSISDQDKEYVIAHEKAHIKRKDHLWKPFGFLILTVYWFNPFIWLGYVLLCRDIELACDEKVVDDYNIAQKADYSQALLSCSVGRRMISACPLAFGEVGVKGRVKSVLNYKKPAFWIIFVAVVTTVVVAVCFLTNPVDANESEDTPEITENESGDKSRPDNTDVIDQSYLSVMTDKQSFYSANREKEMHISDYSSNIWQYAVVDFDADGKNEVAVMLETGDILILRNNGGSVTGFYFGARAMYQINKDGSFNWNGNSGNTYGCSTLQFSGNEFKTVELWRIEHHESGSVTYYVNSNPVSKEVFEGKYAKTGTESVTWIIQDNN